MYSVCLYVLDSSTSQLADNRGTLKSVSVQTVSRPTLEPTPPKYKSQTEFLDANIVQSTPMVIGRELGRWHRDLRASQETEANHVVILSLYRFILVRFELSTSQIQVTAPTDCQTSWLASHCHNHLNTLRTGDANLGFYITTVQDG